MYAFIRKHITCTHGVGVWSCEECIDLAFQEDSERNELRDTLTKARQRIAHAVINTTLIATRELVVPTDAASSIIRFTPAREDSSNRWTVYVMNINGNRYVFLAHQARLFMRVSSDEYDDYVEVGDQSSMRILRTAAADLSE